MRHRLAMPMWFATAAGVANCGDSSSSSDVAISSKKAEVVSPAPNTDPPETSVPAECVEPIALGAVKAEMCNEGEAEDCRVRVAYAGPHADQTAAYALCLLVEDLCRAGGSRLPWRLKRSLERSGLRLGCRAAAGVEMCDSTGCAVVPLARRCPFVRRPPDLHPPAIEGPTVWNMRTVGERPLLLPRIPAEFRTRYRMAFDGTDVERRLEAALYYAQELSRASRFEGMVDAYQAPAPVRDLSLAIGMMVPSNFVERGAKCLEVNVESTAQAPAEGELCSCEPFAEDPRVRAPAPCTVFALDEHYLATAGHCIDVPESCADAEGRRCTLAEDPNSARTLLFAYRRESDNDPAIDLQPHHVVDGSRVEVLCYSQPPGDHDDWALLRSLDPLPTNASVVLSADAARVDDQVSVLGHVLAAPLKYSIPGPVREVVAAESFRAEVDGFTGNSGSPVFAASGQVVGIFRGSKDASLHQCPPAPDPATCYYLPRCPEGECTKPPLVMQIEPLRNAYNRALAGDPNPCNQQQKDD